MRYFTWKLEFIPYIFAMIVDRLKVFLVESLSITVLQLKTLVSVLINAL